MKDIINGHWRTAIEAQGMDNFDAQADIAKLTNEYEDGQVHAAERLRQDHQGSRTSIQIFDQSRFNDARATDGNRGNLSIRRMRRRRPRTPWMTNVLLGVARRARPKAAGPGAGAGLGRSGGHLIDALPASGYEIYNAKALKTADRQRLVLRWPQGPSTAGKASAWLRLRATPSPGLREDFLDIDRAPPSRPGRR